MSSSKKPPGDPPNKTVADVAEYLGVTPRTVYQMVTDHRLRAYTLGGRILRFRLSDVEAALRPSDSDVA